MHNGVSARLGVSTCSASRGASYIILVWNITQSVRRTGGKMKHSDTRHTNYLIDNWGMHFDNQTFRMVPNGWTGCRDAFYAVLHFKHSAMG